MGKTTEKEKRAMLDKLIATRKFLETDENTRPIIEAWREFIALPKAKQMHIRKEWEDYFQKVAETTAYKLFREQEVAMQENNFARVRELAADAAAMRRDGYSELPKPTSPDPFDFDFGMVVKTYKEVDYKIKMFGEYSDDELKQIFSATS